MIVPLHGAVDVDRATAALDAVAGRGVAVLDLGATAAAPDVAARIPAVLRHAERIVAQGGEACVACPDARPEALSSLPRQASLSDCLAAVAPVSGRVFEVALSLPARLDYLAPVRKHLAGVIRALHDDADAFQVEILVDELCLNAVENSPSSMHAYDVRFRCEGLELQVEVTNLFDASVEPEPIMHGRLESFDDSGGYLGERGRGLFLIARIADGLQIRSLDGDRIRVTVTKRLATGKAAEGRTGDGVGRRPAIGRRSRP